MVRPVVHRGVEQRQDSEGQHSTSMRLDRAKVKRGIRFGVPFSFLFEPSRRTTSAAKPKPIHLRDVHSMHPEPKVLSQSLGVQCVEPFDNPRACLWFLLLRF